MPKIRSIKIVIPSLPEKKKIVDILASIDKSIESEDIKKKKSS